MTVMGKRIRSPNITVRSHMIYSVIRNIISENRRRLVLHFFGLSETKNYGDVHYSLPTS